MYVDVHTHLTHASFAQDAEAVAIRAADAGLDCVIVNGLEPRSNRAVLELCERHGHLYPALGIYPVDAVASAIDRDAWSYDFDPPAPFDVDEEIDFIDSVADRIVAIGECGLDQYWVRDQAEEQERVLRRFCEVALKHDKPMILHSRKAETRTLAILQEMGIKRADFHCFGGKLKLARKIADAGYFLSIPTVVVRSEAFQRMVRELPLDRLLTETDAPYMGPDRGERNEPATVPRAISAMAEVRGVAVEVMRDAVRDNCRTLFRV
jgi:TatD DNase family protein